MTEHADIGLGSNSALVAIIRQEIAANGGRITFARFMELALYHPEHGYYLSEYRRPGRTGDFLTAPEATPYFGITLAKQIADCWERLGRPARFDVREYGSGIGGLAYDIIAGLSTFAPGAAGLTYRLVEINEHRQEQARAAFSELGLFHLIQAESPNDDLPPITGVVLANEVADALPVHRLTVNSGSIAERYVVWKGDWFGEETGVVSPAARPLAAALTRQGIEFADGSAIDISPAAGTWFANAAAGIDRGYVLILDYGYPAKELYRGHRLAGTVRGYFEHTVTDNPFVRVGEQDLTAHVDFTALEQAGRRAGLVPAGFATQAEFLIALGLGEVLLDLQKDLTTTVPDYLAAQAAVLRLIDPAGLGRFGVLAMARDAPVDPPLLGFSVPSQ